MIGVQTENIPINIPVDEHINSSSWLESLKGLGFEDLINTIASSLVRFGLRLVLAIFVFYVGRFLIGRIYKTVFNIMTRREVDPSLTTFVLSLVKITLYFILIIIVIGILGVETSSFIAIFASAGVAIGMALSGTLQNFAGGVLILLLKPYKVGDFIEVQDYTGRVKSIQLFNTIINTVDNKAIIIPNGVLSTSSINNYSLEDYRRVDLSISLSYGTSIEDAKKAMFDIVVSDVRTVRKYIEDDMAYREKIIETTAVRDSQDLKKDKKHSWLYRLFHRQKQKLENAGDIDEIENKIAQPDRVDRSPFIGLYEMADSAIVFTVRVWTHSSNYWPLYFDLNERLYTELQARGFSFPFPQLDVHLDQPDTSA